MKMKTIRAIACVMATTMVLAGCGLQDINKLDDEAVVEESVEETVEEVAVEASTEATTEVEETVEEVAEEPEADDFNDFVEVSFEPKAYPVANDGNPDYTGIYCEDGYSSNYGYCKLIKQEDGSYYCDIYSYRLVVMECKAVFKSEGLLEIQDDEYAGTIAIDGESVTVTESYNGGEEDELVYDTHKYDFPEMEQYTGVYTYTKKNGEVTTITVGYDDNLVPFITVEDEGKIYNFDHMPSDSCIWNFEDEAYGNMLYADYEYEAWVPDAKVFSTAMHRRGDTYIAIKQEGNKSLVYFKHFEPVVMH